MTFPQTSPCTTSAQLAGTWKLAPGRAVTLTPTADGILRVASGGVWATVDGPHGAGRGTESGDHQLVPGRSMWLRAGQRVVLESWRGDAAAHFSWDPVFVEALAPARRVNLAAVAQPLRDLRLAGALAARAAGRLALGLGQLAVDVVHPRKLAAR